MLVVKTRGNAKNQEKPEELFKPELEYELLSRNNSNNYLQSLKRMISLSTSRERYPAFFCFFNESLNDVLPFLKVAFFKASTAEITN